MRLPGRCKRTGRVELVCCSSSSQNPAESSAHNASVPDELWAQRDQPALEDLGCLIVLNFVFDYSFILRVVLFYNKINKV